MAARNQRLPFAARNTYTAAGRLIPIQKSKLTRRKPATVQIVRQGETTKLGYFLDWYNGSE